MTMFKKFFDRLAISRGYVPLVLYLEACEGRRKANREVEALRGLFLQMQGILRDVRREARRLPSLPLDKVAEAKGLEPAVDYSVEVVFQVEPAKTVAGKVEP